MQAGDRIWMPPTLDAPAVSSQFLRTLQSYEPSLLITWHAKRRRFMVEQCTEHYDGYGKNEAGHPKHERLCRRVYVCMVEDEDGGMAPLGPHVIEKLKSIDTAKKYGTGPDALARFLADSDAQQAELTAENERKQNEAIQYSRKHNKNWFQKAWNLIERHDVLRPNK